MMIDLEQAYRTYRGLLVGALGRLARQGLRADPYEALDLVHSFFLDEWPGIVENFDERKGELKPYLYAAFTRYARRAILKRMRLQTQVFDDLDAVFDMSSEPDEGGDTGREVDALAAADAVRALPEEERRVLIMYLETSSEREIARRLSITRYQVHDVLARAIAGIALRLECPEGIDEANWRITRMILGDGLDIRQVARLLGISRQDVRGIQRRNLEILIVRLKRATQGAARIV